MLRFFDEKGVCVCLDVQRGLDVFHKRISTTTGGKQQCSNIKRRHNCFSFLSNRFSLFSLTHHTTGSSPGATDSPLPSSSLSYSRLGRPSHHLMRSRPAPL